MDGDRCWSCNHYDYDHQTRGRAYWSGDGCNACECEAFVHEYDEEEFGPDTAQQQLERGPR
jgi:hypothetical protein